MTFSFNLVDHPWIPCAMLPEGKAEELSLREVFERAYEVREISDSSPLATISIHRLLLAILHRTHGPASSDDWQDIWDAKTFDVGGVRSYLETWRHRFDLFDEERPFYQTVEPEPEYARSIAQMVFGLTLGNYATLFDHSLQHDPPALSPAEAARQLLAIQNFAVGGLTPYRSKHGEPATPYKYVQNALLTKGAVALVRGQNLFETLMLNLVEYNSGTAERYQATLEADLPAWERDEPARAIDRPFDGYIDLLTWQNRRVRLLPEVDTEGRTVVRYAIVMKGHQPSKGIEYREYETMLAFTKHPKPAKGQDPWSMLSLRTDRALWRDSTALFQRTGADSQRPRVFDWVDYLARDGAISRDSSYSVDIFGLSSDRSNVDLWRHEQLPLPVSILEDRERLSEIGSALEFARQVSGLFVGRIQEIPTGEDDKTRKQPSPTQQLAERLLRMNDDADPDRQAVQALASTLASTDSYWAQLEAPYKQHLARLGETGLLEARHTWSRDVGNIARSVWRLIIGNQTMSARALKARSLADKAFGYQLYALQNRYAPLREEAEQHETDFTPTEVY